ncbi:Erythronolide synthase, modules 1 and 2 OS=Streptomyces lavendulae subsp. lavendulae OX=58340 GN=eryA7 PE=4 SV=1 [Streptomyces lavendulae subsp. lavendulae]
MAGGAPLLEELDRLESVLEQGTGDNVVRARVTMRLQSLLARWNESGDPAAGPAGPGAADGSAAGGPAGEAADGADSGIDAVEQLQDASDEELFAFINKGLGRY